MNKLVVGNLKMNMSTKDISNYLNEMSELKYKNVVICPSSLYLPYFLKQKFKAGLQNIYHEDLGAYTGELCAKQAVTMGVYYTLIGHNERKVYLHETKEEINKKLKAAKKYNMASILCIGEDRKDYRSHRTKKVIKEQLKSYLMNVGDLNRIIIAYEPNWAIGTNIIPTAKEISEVVKFIKHYISKHYHTDIKVLYGGSVNIDNILTIRNIEEIDGILVGNASTRAKEFLDIIEAFFIRQN